MAGDWIKMRVDLRTDPAVIIIADATQLEEDTVVGKLHRVWSWADRQSRDGNARGVTETWLDRYVCVKGFARAMEKAGWLCINEGEISFPNFERHMSQSAKARALAAKRQSVLKSRKGNAESVTSALPEKRREEYIPPKSPLGDFSLEDARNAWISSVQADLSAERITAAIAEAERWSPAEQCAAYQHALANGRRKLTRPKSDGVRKPQMDPTTAREMLRAKIVREGRKNGLPEAEIEAAVERALRS